MLSWSVIITLIVYMYAYVSVIVLRPSSQGIPFLRVASYPGLPTQLLFRSHAFSTAAEKSYVGRPGYEATLKGTQ